jgi:uncharacterized protein YacL
MQENIKIGTIFTVLFAILIGILFYLDTLSPYSPSLFHKKTFIPIIIVFIITFWGIVLLIKKKKTP